MGQVIDWIIVKWKGFSLPLPIYNNLFKQAVVYIFSGQKPDNLYPKAAFLYKIDHAGGGTCFVHLTWPSIFTIWSLTVSSTTIPLPEGRNWDVLIKSPSLEISSVKPSLVASSAPNLSVNRFGCLFLSLLSAIDFLFKSSSSCRGKG